MPLDSSSALNLDTNSTAKRTVERGQCGNREASRALSDEGVAVVVPTRLATGHGSVCSARASRTSPVPKQITGGWCGAVESSELRLCNARRKRSGGGG